MKTLAIITPTYNRGNLLNNAYESLMSQTNKDFVWYIIDDGSVDNTEYVVEQIKQKSDFEIVYLKKENGGKHTALNVAYDLEKEELTLILDSDDELTNDAVETILVNYKEIVNNDDICGLGYLICRKDSTIVGKKYTKDGITDSFTNQRINKNTYGDKCEVFKTAVLTKYRFPEFNDEKFVSESTIWCKMSLDYKMKFYNKAIYVCEYYKGGLSDGVHKRLFLNPKGAVECYLSMSSKQTNLKYRTKYTVAYTVYSFAAKYKLKQQIKRISSKFLYIATLLPAWLIYLNKRRKYGK